MKTLLNKLPKGRIPRWGFLAGLLIAVGASVAWNNEVPYKLGGGFIGTAGAGSLWSAQQTPLDPAGRTAAVRVNTLAGDTGNTEATGEAEMISRDTAKWTLVTYVTQGNPAQISQIWVLVGTFKFTGPDSLELNYTLKIYPAAADANGDGFPDPGATPFEIPGLTGTAKRVLVP